MKISEVMKQLEELETKLGDVDCFVLTEDEEGIGQQPVVVSYDRDDKTVVFSYQELLEAFT